MIYYYPNKPILLTRDSLQVQQLSNDSNWWAEIKKNGSRLCLWKSKQDAAKHKSFNDFIFWNRTKEVLNYFPSTELLDELNSLNIPDGTHIDAELLHQKTKHIKHYIYVYDIYRYKGQEVMESLEVRRRMIEDIVKDGLKHVQLAKTYSNDFVNLYDKVTVDPENEGLVMKNKNGKIVWNLKTCVEVPWQFKIRKANGSYSD
jgi:hypothetical protein